MALETASLHGNDEGEEPGNIGKSPPPLESVNSGASPGWKDATTTLEVVTLRGLLSIFPW